MTDNTIINNPVYPLIPPCSLELIGSKTAKTKQILIVIPREYVRLPVAVEIYNPQGTTQEKNTTIAELTTYTEESVQKKKFSHQHYAVRYLNIT